MRQQPAEAPWGNCSQGDAGRPFPTEGNAAGGLPGVGGGPGGGPGIRRRRCLLRLRAGRRHLVVHRRRRRDRRTPAPGAADFPANQRILSGSGSWLVSGTTSALTFPEVLLAGWSNVTVRYHVSSTAATSGGGATPGDSVAAYVATTTYANQAKPVFGSDGGHHLDRLRQRGNVGIPNGRAPASSSPPAGTDAAPGRRRPADRRRLHRFRDPGPRRQAVAGAEALPPQRKHRQALEPR